MQTAQKIYVLHIEIYELHINIYLLSIFARSNMLKFIYIVLSLRVHERFYKKKIKEYKK